MSQTYSPASSGRSGSMPHSRSEVASSGVVHCLILLADKAISVRNLHFENNVSVGDVLLAFLNSVGEVGVDLQKLRSDYLAGTPRLRIYAPAHFSSPISTYNLPVKPKLDENNHPYSPYDERSIPEQFLFLVSGSLFQNHRSPRPQSWSIPYDGFKTIQSCKSAFMEALSITKFLNPVYRLLPEFIYPRAILEPRNYYINEFKWCQQFMDKFGAMKLEDVMRVACQVVVTETAPQKSWPSLFETAHRDLEALTENWRSVASQYKEKPVAFETYPRIPDTYPDLSSKLQHGLSSVSASNLHVDSPASEKQSAKSAEILEKWSRDACTMLETLYNIMACAYQDRKTWDLVSWEPFKNIRIVVEIAYSFVHAEAIYSKFKRELEYLDGTKRRKEEFLNKYSKHLPNELKNIYQATCLLLAPGVIPSASMMGASSAYPSNISVSQLAASEQFTQSKHRQEEFWKQRASELQHRLQVLTSQSSSVTSLETQLAQCKEETHSLTEKYEGTLSKYQEKREEAEKTKEKLSLVERQVEELKAFVESQKTEWAQNAADAQNMAASQQQTADKSLEEVARVKSEIEQSQSEMEELKSEMAKQKVEFLRQAKELEARTASLTQTTAQEKDELQKIIESLRQKEAQMVNENSKLVDQSEELVVNSVEKTRQLEIAYSNLEQEIHQLNLALISRNQQISEVETLKAALELEVEKWKSEAQQVESKLSQSTQKADTSKSEVSRLQDIVKTHETEIQSLKKKKEEDHLKHEVELQATMNRIHELGDELSGVTAQLLQLQEGTPDTHTRSRDASETGDQVLAYRLHVEELADEDSATLGLEELRQLVKALKVTNGDLKNQNTILTTSSNPKPPPDSTLELLQKRVQLLEAENNEYQAQCDIALAAKIDLESEVGDLNRELTKAQHSMNWYADKYAAEQRIAAELRQHLADIQ